MHGGAQISLRLLDIPQCVERLEATGMELQDSASALLSDVVCTTDYAVAFAGADVALLVGARPRGKGMLRSDLLTVRACVGGCVHACVCAGGGGVSCCMSRLPSRSQLHWWRWRWRCVGGTAVRGVAGCMQCLQCCC